MPSALPISRLVNVSVNLSPIAAQMQNLSTLLIMGSSEVIDVVERLRNYSTVAEVAADFWQNIPECDILVTHGPPFGIFDKCPVSVGCRALLKAVKRIQPSLHVFGHIHEGYSGKLFVPWLSGKKTLFANVSVVDGDYRLVSKPPVFDIEKSADGRILIEYSCLS